MLYYKHKEIISKERVIMTGQEFTKRFNDLIATSNTTIDMSVAATLRSEIEADYQSAADNSTLLTTANSTITELQSQNKQLHDTNLRLFMSLPSGSNSPSGSTKQSPSDDNSNEHHDEHNEPTFPTCDELVSAMFGKSSK